MTSYHYTLSGNNDFKNKMFTGFSQLQKQEEFVDLTLAADGYLIKVHRNIIAVASPYLKEMIKSVPNHSPVVFLNNVSHKVLSYVLEYIYQGEVNIPVDSISEFIDVSKSLHIAGISDVQQPQKPPPILTTNKEKDKTRASEFAAHITIDNSNLIEVQPCPTHNEQFESDQMNISYELTTDMAEEKKSANIKDNAKFIGNDIYNTPYMPITGQNQDQFESDQMNVSYELTTDMAEEKKSVNIKDIAKSIGNDIYNTPYMPITGQNQEYNTEIFQNVPLVADNSNIEANKYTEQSYSYNLLQTQTDILHQENQINVNTIPISPIEVTTDIKAAYSQTNTAQINNYKIIVKPQSEMEHADKTNGLPNIPVIVIQHSELQGQQVMASGDHHVLPMQTDITSQTLQEDPPNPSTDRNQTINTKIKKATRASMRKVKILDKKNFKPGIKSSEIIFRLLQEEETDALPLDSEINLDAMKNMAQFSLTERGALQMILNRYIYCNHHSSRQKLRWRCVDYRRRACPAFVDTVNGAISTRKGLHTHEFHDKKLYKKHEKGLIYQTIEQAKVAQELLQKDYLESVLLDDADSDK